MKWIIALVLALIVMLVDSTVLNFIAIAFGAYYAATFVMGKWMKRDEQVSGNHRYA